VTASDESGILLAPTGHEAVAMDVARRELGQYSWRTITRGEFRGCGVLGIIRSLRSVAGACFAVYSPSFDNDPDLSLLRVAALVARARRRMLIDADGQIREFSTMSWLVEPVRVVVEGIAAGVAVALAYLWSMLPQRHTAHTARRMGAVLYLRPVSGTNLNVGGSHTHTAGVIGAFADLGLDVHVITNVQPPFALRANVVIERQHPFPSLIREASDLAYNLRLARRAAGLTNADSVAFVYQRHAALSVAGYLVAVQLGVPLVLEYNASEAWARRHWGNNRLVGLIRRLERIVLKHAALVVAVSEPLVDELRGLGIPDERIALAPNGVDPNLFDPTRVAHESAALRRRLGVAPGQPLIGFLGTFGPWHGTTVLAEAIPRVLQGRPDARFLIVGEGSGRATFEASIAAAGDSHAVIMVGAIAHADVPGHLAACDILVSPHVPMPNGKRFFGSPTKLFEYMAMGKPIIASRLEQLERVLVDGRTARLVEPGSASDLADAILELSNDAHRATALGVSARLVACERHTWTKVTAGWLPRIGASSSSAVMMVGQERAALLEA